ncbi:hypothetical protein LSG31_02680 [Fodinisporobacter ferrooxydans]|uniref:DUF1641 domain-containing protein n=1 Tax=Fodinisporobacter ferrooxydans TaxID=2901836 RepID=A0ABY4CKZ1_9BACL|nr:hypothetical protein LSG31_02680 [Alicyclobacillaceae bacterium MYW30-H2]
MSNIAATTNREELLRLLENDEISHALQTALEKLPKFMEQYSAMEKTVGVFQEITKYRTSITDLVTEFSSLGTSQLPEITIGNETLEAIATFINKLPKIAEYLTVMEELMDLAQTVLSDKKTMEFMFKGVQSMTEPMQTKIKEGISLVEEAKIRANADSSTMSIFSVMKLLKDPMVQEGLKFTKAFLEVVSERKKT